MTWWSPIVFALTSYDLGSGPSLYAGGRFGQAGGVFVSNIARWDGASWSPLGTGLPEDVPALLGFDDGSGAALYAGRASSTNGISRWNGSNWSTPGPGLIGSALAFASFPQASGPSLYVCGSFIGAGTVASNHIARWAAPRPVIGFTTVPGSASVHDTGLRAGHEYYNIFSVDVCALPGGGPYLGLCSTNLTNLIAQFLLPLGTPPFHFVATGMHGSFGPFALPSGFTADAVCFDFTGGQVGCVSAVTRMTVP
jgi:hypothetical protein